MTNFKTLKNLIDEKDADKQQAWYNFCEYQGSSVSTRRILESSYRKAYGEYSTVVAACITVVDIAMNVFNTNNGNNSSTKEDVSNTNKNNSDRVGNISEKERKLFLSCVDNVEKYYTDDKLIVTLLNLMRNFSEKEIKLFIQYFTFLKSDILDEHEEFVKREKKAVFDKLVNDVVSIKTGVQNLDEAISEKRRLIHISPADDNKSELCKEYERLVDVRDMHKDELRSIYEAIEDVRPILKSGQYPNKDAMKIAVMIRRRQFLRLNVPLYSKVFLNCALFTVDDLDEIKNIINGSPKEKGTTMFKRRKKK